MKTTVFAVLALAGLVGCGGTETPAAGTSSAAACAETCPAGAPGPAGAAGAQGPEGQRGIAGPIGPAGAQGPQGATGAPGPVGAAGAQGPQGAAGPAGAAGARGATGAAGPAFTPALYTVESVVQNSGGPGGIGSMDVQCSDANDTLLSGGCEIVQSPNVYVPGWTAESAPFVESSGRGGWRCRIGAIGSNGTQFKAHALCARVP